MAVTPGQILSHYRLVEKIGVGGVGVVYEAIDIRIDRRVAVKFLAYCRSNGGSSLWRLTIGPGG